MGKFSSKPKENTREGEEDDNALGIQVPAEMNCIIQPTEGRGGLYLGSKDAAFNKKNLEKQGISAALTVCNEVTPKFDKKGFIHKVIPAKDTEHYQISTHFVEGINFIKENIEKTNVLVHCYAGMSRSTSIVIAYLIQEKKMDLKTATKYVRERRKVIAGPNAGFYKQLKAFEANLISHQVKAPESSDAQTY